MYSDERWESEEEHIFEKKEKKKEERRGWGEREGMQDEKAVQGEEERLCLVHQGSSTLWGGRRIRSGSDVPNVI